MNYYSTGNRKLKMSLREAVLGGLAPDGGLYMPGEIPKIPEKKLEGFRNLDFRGIAREVASCLFETDLEKEEILKITDSAITFDAPLTEVEEGIYSLELFHGPTLAFKDIGARFMARMLGHFTVGLEHEINVLVATSGDTGSAVASGFRKVPGIRVFILYPSGGVSHLQEQQLTTLGENITALEIRGSFDDCQRLVKSAFRDQELARKLILTSANSINLARFLPQSFYYFNAWARLPRKGEFIVSVPSGNFGNLTAGLIAGRMGLPVRHYVVATNINDVVPEYLRTAKFSPRPSVATIANAMDVGNPSNFDRILDLFGHSHREISSMLTGYSFSDDEIRETIAGVYTRTGYLLDPHGAAGYEALISYLSSATGKTGKSSGRTEKLPGVFLETAHPGKFSNTVEEVIGKPVAIPEALRSAAEGRKVSILLDDRYESFRDFLIRQA